MSQHVSLSIGLNSTEPENTALKKNKTTIKQNFKRKLSMDSFVVPKILGSRTWCKNYRGLSTPLNPLCWRPYFPWLASVPFNASTLLVWYDKGNRACKNPLQLLTMVLFWKIWSNLQQQQSESQFSFVTRTWSWYGQNCTQSWGTLRLETNIVTDNIMVFV